MDNAGQKLELPPSSLTRSAPPMTCQTQPHRTQQAALHMLSMLQKLTSRQEVLQIAAKRPCNLFHEASRLRIAAHGC